MNDLTDDRRMQIRVPTTLEGALVCKDVDEPCTVMNLSQGGAMIRTSGQISFNQPVTLMVKQVGEFVGEMVWHDDKCSGWRVDDRQAWSTENSGSKSDERQVIGLDPFGPFVHVA